MIVRFRVFLLLISKISTCCLGVKHYHPNEFQDVDGEKRGAKKKKRMKKGGKKGKKRKEKDLTPDRTTESLFEEMVLNGTVIQ